MKAELIKIGNSQGIRIPKPIIEQCGFKKAVNIEVRGYSLVIEPISGHRKGWSEAFQNMHKNKNDRLLDIDLIESEFDKTEWVW